MSADPSRPSSEVIAQLFAAADELARRGLIDGVPTQLLGQLGEQIARLYFESRGHTIQSASRDSGFDFWVDGRDRVEVKTVRHDPDNAARSPSISVRSLDFDQLAVVLIGARIENVAMLIVPAPRVEALSKPHRSGFTLRVTPAVVADPRVLNVSAEVVSLLL